MPSGLIIVTGGSRGIGAAICRRLAADGYAIAVNYAADAKAAEATAAAIEKSGGRAQAFQADVADPAALHDLFDKATRALGPLDGARQQRRQRGPLRPGRRAGRSRADAALRHQRDRDDPRLQGGGAFGFRPGTAGPAARSSTSRRSRQGSAGCRDSRPTPRPRARSRASPRASPTKSAPRESGSTPSRPE